MARAAGEHAAQGRSAEAIEAYAQALALTPDDADLLTRLALLQRNEGDLDEAIANFERALAHAPDLPVARLNLALALDEAGDSARALALIDQAPDLLRASADARWMASVPVLRAGDLARGFAWYEARFDTGDRNAFRRHGGVPRWTGSAAPGKRLLLWHEQGLGDLLQFIRFVPLAAARGLEVRVEAPAPLRALLAGAPGVTLTGAGQSAGVTLTGAHQSAFDFQLPAMSLPHVLGIALDQVGADLPYLAAPAARRGKWRTLLPDSKAFRIGLAWRSTIFRDDLAVAQSKLSKSLPLALLQPFAQLPGVELVSLQVGQGAEEMRQAGRGMRITDLNEHIDDFADTAALIERLDLVVSIDTSVAHLAGAMGRPVFVLLNHSPCWRWLAGRDDSPWYPSARLFRQARRNDWRDPVAAACAAASALAGAAGPARGVFGLLRRK